MNALVTLAKLSLDAYMARPRHLVLFIPSRDQRGNAVDQAQWTEAALALLGRCHRGGTAFPPGRGVWQDGSKSGKLMFDDTVVVQCFTRDADIRRHQKALLLFLATMCVACDQKAVGWVVNGKYHELRREQIKVTEKQRGA